MKNYLFIIAALISFNSFGQVHKSVETVSDGSKNKVPMELVVLSEPSEGAFFASLSTEFTDLVFGEETLESVGKDELLNRIAISSSIKAKYMCTVKASWVPESVNFMWSEDKYFGIVKGTATNTYGVKDEVKVYVSLLPNGDIVK